MDYQGKAFTQQARYDALQAARMADVQERFRKFQAREGTGGGFSNTPIDRWQLQNYEFNRGLR